MAWQKTYTGSGVPGEANLPPAPPWRTFPRPEQSREFRPAPGLADAVNAALCLRRPLLITGAPGSGKSSVIDSVAAELGLGRVLRWHVTSRSSLTEALYRYDVLGRIHAQQLAQHGAQVDIAPFLRFGPLGTALLPADRPRALLIDEIDKSDLDLPSDLLDVLERGVFEIPELVRLGGSPVRVREWDGEQEYPVDKGMVACSQFPFIVLTSNAERDFPAPFLRRCIRFNMPAPDETLLKSVVSAHLGDQLSDLPGTAALIEDFVARVRRGDVVAVDQLLNAVYLLSGMDEGGEQYNALRNLLMRELSGA